MKDFREKWVLNTGDTIVSGEYTYTITGAPFGYGGSSILYPVKRTGSELCYAIKECFPNVQGRFERKNGVVALITEDDTDGKQLLELYREMFQKERTAGQTIRNSTGRSIGMWETFRAQKVTISNQTYDASQGIYALLERMDGKGCSLLDILKECREEVSSLYPLRTGGLPNIYTTACIMEQILRAVQGVHESGYLFGDIQVNNIFFMDSHLGEGDIGFGCLFDFGCARSLMEDGYTEEITDCKVFSTEGYVPPEILYGNNGHLRLGKQADVYSAGKLMLLCLLTDGQELTESSRSMKRLLQSYHGKKIGCDGTRLDLVNAILEKSLRTEPQERYRDAKDMLGDILKLKKLTEPPKFRLQKNMSSPDYFVPGSREKEIKALKESMLKGEYPMLWGYGGMGKTETAIELAKRMENGKGAYLVHFKNSMRETILELKFSGYRYEPDKRISLEEQEEREYRERLNLLKDYYEDSIIVIDNFDNEEKTLDELRREKEFADLAGLNLRLIFTTRYPVGRKEWEITELGREDLLNIMKYYLKSISVSDEELYELIEAAGSHTLTIVLMAKTLEESWGTVTPDMILEAFRNASISDKSFPEVVSDQNRTYSQEQIYQHLKVLFNLSGMSEDEKKVLSYAVLLPEGGMDVIMFMDCLEKEEQKCLRKLVAKGWLRRQEGNLLTIYPIIRQVCRAELKPNDDVCEGFLINLREIYDKVNYNFSKYSQMAEFLSRASEYLNDENGFYSNFSGVLYFDISKYETGLKYLQKALKIQERKFLGGCPELVTTYTNLGNAYGKLGDYEKSLECSKKALKIQEEISSPIHLDFVKVYDALGRAYGDLGEYEKQLEYGQKALKIIEETLPSNHSDIVWVYSNLGCAYVKVGKYEKGLEYFQKALKIWIDILPSNHPNLATIYNNIGHVYGDLGEYEKQLEYGQKALKIMEEILPPNHLDVAMGHNSLGSAYVKVREYKKGLECFQRALRIIEETLPSDHPDIAMVYNNLGNVYGKLGKNVEQLKYCQMGLEIQEKILPANHPDFAGTYTNLGITYGELCQYDKELKCHKKALEIREGILPSYHLDLASTYTNLGVAYEHIGAYEKGLEYCQKALKIQEEILSTNHIEKATTYIVIGILYGDLNRYKEGLEYFYKALKIQEEVLPSSHSDILALYSIIGVFCKILNRYESGLKCYKKMLRAQERILLPNHLDLAVTCDNIGMMYDELGESKKALKYWKRALEIKEENLLPSNLDMAMEYDRIGVQHGNLNEYEDALNYWKKALRIRKVLSPTDSDIVTTYNNIGYAYGVLGKYEKELEYCQNALRIQEKILPPTHPDRIVVYHNIEYAYVKLGRYEQALEYSQKELRIKKEILPSNAPDFMGIYYKMARYYNYLNNMKQAYIYDEKAANCGDIQSMMRMAKYLIDGKYCEQNYRKAFEWLNKAHTLGSSTATNNLAWMYLHGYGCKKDILKAVELFETAANSEIPSKGACKHLGELYLGLEDTNDIVLCNKSKALYYYQKAKSLGCEGLEEIINQLLS